MALRENYAFMGPGREANARRAHHGAEPVSEKDAEMIKVFPVFGFRINGFLWHYGQPALVFHG